MTETDEKEFLDFVRSTGDVLFFAPLSKTAEFQPLTILPKRTRRWMGEATFYVLNRSVSTRFFIYPPRETKDADKDTYDVNESDSSVARFERCLWEPGSVFDGSIVAISSYLSTDQVTWIPKEPAFLKWFDTLTRWIRKRYTKLSCTTNRIYAGPEAGKLFDEGRLDLILQWGENQELFVEGNLSENRESWRKTKGV